MFIRKMQVGDVPAIVALAQQLGYWVALDEARTRLERILDKDGQGLLVAESDDGQILGWAHGAEVLGILGAPRAEVRALVVDEAQRRKGIGRQLLAELEKWARERGLLEVRMGTQTHRIEAHVFYQRLGYATKKTQHVMALEL